MASVPKTQHEQRVKHLWIASLLIVAGATTADAATSWGGRESNPLLVSQSGTFGTRGVAIKSAAAGALLIPQILLRHHQHLRGAFIGGNLAETALFTATAFHNAHVR